MRSLPGALLIGVLLLTGGSSLDAQISPGTLTRPHAALEGSTNCVQCHGLRKEPMAQRCLACHKEIAWLVARGRGLHAPAHTPPSATCASCHPDHAGADFALIDWGPGGSADFDHARAGWRLDGKHAQAKCASCHRTEFRSSVAATLSPRKHGAGWTGLETSCAGCHVKDDVHRKSLSASCERCHDASDWRKTPYFDHAKARYPLTGKHADVACDKCHAAPQLKLTPAASGRVIGRFRPLPFAECSACHADPHKGRLKGGCSECHSTRGFHEIRRSGFDHALTRYPLLGKHAEVRCERCHGEALVRRTPPFAHCADCHADAHYGRATLAGAAVDCAACHRVEGFAPATYSVAQHQMAKFPLAGRHATMECSRCHAARDSLVRTVPREVRRQVDLRPAFASCASCHQDAHRGERSRSTSGGTCAGCHDERGWVPSTYTAARHAALALPLTGAHAPLACARCHVPVRAAVAAPPGARPDANTVSLRLRPACDACHLDPHAGRYGAGGAKAAADGCRACHDERRWSPARLSPARHADFGVTLEGAHRAVMCNACHKTLGATPARVTLRQGGHVTSWPFDGAPRTACAACHADPHAGQFTTSTGTCVRCHDTVRWAGAARFVHDRDTSFPLAGAHSRVPCAACHRPVAQSGGGTRVPYRSLPTACEGCHADGVPRRRP
ncbi:MAG: hypothetical protein ACYC7F_07700 [Gemmatimonadaceae bacterium]